MVSSDLKTCLHIISTGGFYGAERAVIEISVYMAEHGWRPHIVALEGRGASVLVERAHAMGLLADSFGADRIGLFEMRRRLAAIAGRYSGGIIHSHGYKPDILLALSSFSRQWVRFSTCHTWYSDTWRMKLWEYIDKRVLRTFDCVVPVSGFLERELLESGVSADRIVRIDNGIDAPPRSPADGIAIRQELGLSADDALIVQIGRLAKSKRNDLLIEALTHLPNFPRLHIALVGDGEQRAALQQMVHHERLDGRVHFMGYRPDAHRFLSAADILAITSDHEGLPIVLLEAMAAHCPVVSTDVGAIGDVLKNGESAWLVPPNNVESLAASLSEALASPAEAIRRATRARAVFELKHSRTSMGSHYLSLYEQAWNLRYKDAGKH